MNPLRQLQQCYQQKLGVPADFYPSLKALVASDTCEFIQHPGFLAGIQATKPPTRHQLIETKPGDVRVDAPVWFGDIRAKRRIMIVGQEPRDTDSAFKRRAPPERQMANSPN